MDRDPDAVSCTVWGHVRPSFPASVRARTDPQGGNGCHNTIDGSGSGGIHLNPGGPRAQTTHLAIGTGPTYTAIASRSEDRFYAASKHTEDTPTPTETIPTAVGMPVGTRAPTHAHTITAQSKGNRQLRCHRSGEFLTCNRPGPHRDGRGQCFCTRDGTLKHRASQARNDLSFSRRFRVVHETCPVHLRFDGVTLLSPLMMPPAYGKGTGA